MGVRACVKVCVCLSMVHFETTRTASSTLSPVSVGAQKSYMTLQCSWVLSKKNVCLVLEAVKGSLLSTT